MLPTFHRPRPRASLEWQESLTALPGFPSLGVRVTHRELGRAAPDLLPKGMARFMNEKGLDTRRIQSSATGQPLPWLQELFPADEKGRKILFDTLLWEYYSIWFYLHIFYLFLYIIQSSCMQGCFAELQPGMVQRPLREGLGTQSYESLDPSARQEAERLQHAVVWTLVALRWVLSQYFAWKDADGLVTLETLQCHVLLRDEGAEALKLRSKYLNSILFSSQSLEIR